jgi:hypothetical protein
MGEVLVVGTGLGVFSKDPEEAVMATFVSLRNFCASDR